MNARRVEHSKWYSRAILFADGHHGSAIQVHQVMTHDQEPTPIVSTWTKVARNERGVIRWFYKDTEYPDFNDAVAAWREDGEPKLEISPQDYLAPSTFKKAGQ